MKVFGVPREKNHEVDVVAKLVASRTAKMPRNILVETVKAPYTKRIVVCNIKKKED